jgi:hypothetical protein
MGSLALHLLRGYPLLAALLGVGLHGLPPSCLWSLRSNMHRRALSWAALCALRPWSLAWTALLRRPWCGGWCSGGCLAQHHRWCLGHGVLCFSVHRVHGRGANLRCKAASATWLLWSGLLALLPCLPPCGMGGLPLRLLRGYPLLAALLGVGLHGLPVP